MRLETLSGLQETAPVPRSTALASLPRSFSGESKGTVCLAFSGLQRTLHVRYRDRIRGRICWIHCLDSLSCHCYLNASILFCFLVRGWFRNCKENSTRCSAGPPEIAHATRSMTESYAAAIKNLRSTENSGMESDIFQREYIWGTLGLAGTGVTDMLGGVWGSNLHLHMYVYLRI